MLNNFYPLTIFVLLSFSIGEFSNEPQEKQKKTVTRVKRPDFHSSDRNDIYFDDIFSEGLVGSAPEVAGSVDFSGKNESAASAVNSGERWSSFISRDTIEDEIKLMHQSLQRSVTTPSGFNSKFREVRQQFNLLSMLFGIIHEYDQDIRWKRFAGTYQISAAETAAKALKPTRPAFQAAKTARDDLGELVRGGGITINKKVETTLQWSDVIQRRSIMTQLDAMVGEILKPGVSSKDEFKNNRDKILRSANLVSAMAKVLTKEGMDEAEDDGYVAFAKKMGAAANQLKLATQSDEFDTATKAVNRIEQSCTDCHAEWN